jgi:hypothetical protein
MLSQGGEGENREYLSVVSCRLAVGGNQDSVSWGGEPADPELFLTTFNRQLKTDKP